MDRLTRKSESGMTWFVDKEHERGYVEREPCEMNSHHARLSIEKLAEYEDLQEKLDKQFDGCVELEMIVDAIIKYDEQFNRDEKLSAAMLITNDSVRKYQEWKDLEKQGILLKNPEKLKHNILARMEEFADEYRSYSESSIDYHGGRADAMEADMRIVKAEFSEAVNKPKYHVPYKEEAE